MIDRLVKRKNFRRLSVLSSALLVAVFILAMAAQAEAAYYVQAKQGTGYWYGAYSSNYVMSNPTVNPGSWKVNAVFCETLNRTAWVECGWWKDGDSPYACEHFGARYNTSEGYHEDIYGSATPGTNHTYGVRWMADTQLWRYYVDGVAKPDRANNAITSAVIATNAETHNSNDSNYGHWWSLQYWDKDAAQWKLWTNLVQNRDDDPNYKLTKTSNTECYSEHI